MPDNCIAMLHVASALSEELTLDTARETAGTCCSYMPPSWAIQKSGQLRLFGPSSLSSCWKMLRRVDRAVLLDHVVGSPFLGTPPRRTIGRHIDR